MKTIYDEVQMMKEALECYRKISEIDMKAGDYRDLCIEANELLGILREDEEQLLSSEGNGKGMIHFVNALETLGTQLNIGRLNERKIKRAYCDSLLHLPEVERELDEFLSSRNE